MHGVVATRARGTITEYLVVRFPNSHITIPKMSHAICALRATNMSQAHIFRAVFYLSLARISLPSTAYAAHQHTQTLHTSFVHLFVVLARIGRERENRAASAVISNENTTT